MEGLIIRSRSKENLKLLSSLAKKLGEDVKPISMDEMEDLYLGQLMKKVKTGKNASQPAVLKKLRSK